MKQLIEELANYTVSVLQENEPRNWQIKDFSNPNAHIRLATVFSSIGAIEQAYLE